MCMAASRTPSMRIMSRCSATAPKGVPISPACGSAIDWSSARERDRPRGRSRLAISAACAAVVGNKGRACTFHRLGSAHYEIAIGRQNFMEFCQRRALGERIEIEKHIAAIDDVDLAEPAVGIEQVEGTKRHHAP